jgi:hypothetical protein
MLLRNSNTGGLEVYDIANNQITNAVFIGTIGTDWQFSGVGNFSVIAGETDLLLRNGNTGGLEVYDINNNQLTGAAEWSVSLSFPAEMSVASASRQLRLNLLLRPKPAPAEAAPAQRPRGSAFGPDTENLLPPRFPRRTGTLVGARIGDVAA